MDFVRSQQIESMHDSKLIARKLRDDNSNRYQKCGICGKRVESGLFCVQYDVSEALTIDFGVFCEECRDNIFRFKEEDNIRSAHWVDSTQDFACSLCGHVQNEMTFYCPACGAEMQ